MSFWRSYDCAVCGESCNGKLGLPMFCGLVVPNDWQGEWGGFNVCRPCFDANNDPARPSRPRIANDSLVGRPT